MDERPLDVGSSVVLSRRALAAPSMDFNISEKLLVPVLRMEAVTPILAEFISSLRPVSVLFVLAIVICLLVCVLLAEKAPPLHVPNSKFIDPVPTAAVSFANPENTRVCALANVLISI